MRSAAVCLLVALVLLCGILEGAARAGTAVQRPNILSPALLTNLLATGHSEFGGGRDGWSTPRIAGVLYAGTCSRLARCWTRAVFAL